MSEIGQNTPPAPKKLRLFVAINLPDPLKAVLGEIQREIASELSPKAVRWTNSAQLHITLKFLGYVPQTDLSEIETALRSACAGHCCFDLEAAGTGSFPSLRSPRVIWVGLRTAPLASRGSSDSPLVPLQQQIDTALARWAEPEKREFTPHLTLGRVNQEKPGRARTPMRARTPLRAARRQDLDAIAKFVAAKHDLSFGQWRVGQIDLMQSVLSPHGPTYTCLTSIPLK